MSRFAVIARIRLAPGSFEDYRKAILKNARSSLENEPGCHRFDVLVPSDAENEVVLVEIYEDREVFERHLQTPHFREMQATAGHLIEEVDARELTLLE